MLPILNPFLIATMLMLAASDASAFRFSPFRSKFEPVGPESNQLFLAENNTAVPVSVQIRIANRQIDIDGGETMHDNEKDFVVFPAQMILQSHSSRSVRVQWVGDPKLKDEMAYRIIAEQLPVNLSQDKPKSSSVKFLVSYRAALFVTPSGLSQDVQVDSFGVSQDPKRKGLLELVLHNRGTQHVLLRNLKLNLTDDAGNVVTLSDEVALKGLMDETILANQRRRFLLVRPTTLQGAPKHVEFSFDKQAF
jgi:fimbrial chaperone protein